MVNLGRASQFKSAISSLGIPKSYQRLGAFPLDDSTVFDTIANRDAMVEGVRYQGMTCYVEETDRLYLLKGGIDNSCWTAFNTSDTTEIATIKYTVKNAPVVKHSLVRLVANGEIETADCMDNFEGVIGIALEDGEIDEMVTVKSSGEVNALSDEELIVGRICFLGEDGKVIQSLSDVKAIFPIGMATSTDKINLSINSEELTVIE